MIQWHLSYGHLHHSWGFTLYWRRGALRRGVLSLYLSFLFALICFTSRGEICDVAAVHQSREGWGHVWERGHCGGHPEELGGVVVHQVSQCQCVNVPVNHCSRLVLWSRQHSPDLPGGQTPQKLFLLGTLMCFYQGFVAVCTCFIARLVLILQKIGRNYSYNTRKKPQKAADVCILDVGRVYNKTCKGFWAEHYIDTPQRRWGAQQILSRAHFPTRNSLLRDSPCSQTVLVRQSNGTKSDSVTRQKECFIWHHCLQFL